MNFHIVSLFPGAFDSYLGESILKRAIEDKKIKVKFYNPRDHDKGRVDDKPYGGGPGMVIEALPVIKAIAKVKAKKKEIIWFTPKGKQFTTDDAKKLSKNKDIVFVCGRYEGIDARVKKVYKVKEYSVGPYVLTGGELPAMIMMDSISRQVKGVLGDIASLEETRIAAKDVYTRPETIEYKKKKYRVPPVLLSGHQAKIDEWRKQNAENN